MVVKIMAQYDEHDARLRKDYGDGNWYFYCARCDEWVGEKARHEPCLVKGFYSPDGKVLKTIGSTDEWIADHWDELRVDFGDGS